MAEAAAANSAAATQPPARRLLRGHKADATSCISSVNRPGLIISSDEAGRVCWFDMRCKDVVATMDVAQNPITSLCFRPGNEDIMHITCNSKSSFLAAADDGGDIKIIDIRQKCLYKTLRAAHESICTSVQFLPWRPWEVITGGLDSKLIMWDFSKGRPFKVMDMGKTEPESSSSTQCCNPAFVHAIAVPEVDMLDKVGKMCVVARGDGVVDVINIESEFNAAKSRDTAKPRKGGQLKSTKPENQDQNQRTRLRLDYSFGGHSAAVSCVAFCMFGDKGKYIISGGNDKAVKVWNWSKFFKADQTCNDNDFLHLDIKLSRKVNWLCTTPTDSENIVICDTSKVVKVYTVA